MPEPVLKITTLWSGEILPDESSDFSAAKHAAPSGATKSPSLGSNFCGNADHFCCR